MTPKEKAKELVNGFHTDLYGPGIEANIENRIRCANRCVDEIIKATPFNIFRFDIHASVYEKCREAEEYWKEVKKEINLI